MSKTSGYGLAVLTFALLVTPTSISSGTLGWVSYEFVAGRQCEPAVSRPDPLSLLRELGVRSVFHSCENQAVCRACSCPQYRLDCRYLVEHGDVETLVQAGFTKTEPLATRRYFLMAVDGEQCTLAENNEPALTEETRRLQGANASIHYLWVSSILREDLLPKWCVPSDVPAFFEEHPWAAERVTLSEGSVCEACGCPETWFYCLESSSDRDQMKQLGYAPLP